MAKQIQKTKFPETLYAVQEQDGDTTYLLTSSDPGDLVEVGVAVPAAEYKLVRAGVVIETTVAVR
jgi:hypothetical protein